MIFMGQLSKARIYTCKVDPMSQEREDSLSMKKTIENFPFSFQSGFYKSIVVFACSTHNSDYFLGFLRNPNYFGSLLRSRPGPNVVLESMFLLLVNLWLWSLVFHDKGLFCWATVVRSIFATSVEHNLLLFKWASQPYNYQYWDIISAL